MNSNVKLVSLTLPKIEGVSSPEDLIVYCARVSNPSNQLNTETGGKLLKYCIKNKHWSIFEMVDMCVEIKTSRAIAAQILRHKSASFQEYSQRYASSTENESFELRSQGKTNRQVGEGAIDPEFEFFSEDAAPASKIIEDHTLRSFELYDKLIENGVARESARFVLPLSTQTTMYMKNNIRNWIHYLDVRCDAHTQKEHRDVANGIKRVFKENFPVISEVLNY